MMSRVALEFSKFDKNCATIEECTKRADAKQFIYMQYTAVRKEYVLELSRLRSV